MKRNTCNSLKNKINWLLILYVLYSVILANSLECYNCDSAEEPECATKPGQQIDVEECASETDECVQVVVSGITRRGCLSRLFPSRYCPAPCARCKQSLCNRDVFPTNRQRCYQCSGADCVNVDKKPDLVLPCPFYKQGDRCFLNVLHVSNVVRGCESTMGDNKGCPNTCIKCNYEGCNKEPGMSEQNCIQCSHKFASPNPACWRGQDAAADKCVVSTNTFCKNKNLYGHVGKCYIHVNEQTGIVERGCSSNMPLYTSGSTVQCYGENCNNNCTTISCNVCSSDDLPGCTQGKFLRTEKCEENTQSCFTCELGNRVTRGCADKKFSNRYSNSTIAEQEACYLCRDGNGCNRTPVRTCYSCSSVEHKDCSMMSLYGNIRHQNCSSHDDLCVSTIVSKVHHTYVLRGCLSLLAECTDNDPFCVRCNGSLCNNIPIDLTSNEIMILPIDFERNGVANLDARSGGIINGHYAWILGLNIMCILLLITRIVVC